MAHSNTFRVFPGGVSVKVLNDRQSKPIYNFHHDKWIKIIPEESHDTYKAYLTPIKESADPAEIFKRLSEKKFDQQRSIKPRVPSSSETQYSVNSRDPINSLDRFYWEIRVKKSTGGDRDVRKLWRLYVERKRTQEENYKRKREDVRTHLERSMENVHLMDPIGYLVENNKGGDTKRQMSELLQWKISPTELYYNPQTLRKFSCGFPRDNRRYSTRNRPFTAV